MSVDNNIPKGWVETTLGKISLIGSSKRIFFSDYVDKGVPFYRSKEIIEKQKGNNISTKLFITEEKYNQIEAQFGAPKQNDILLTSVGTLGIPYLVQEKEKFYFKDGNLTWFRNYNGVDPIYLYNWFLSPIGKEGLKKITIGSTQSALTIAGLRTIPIILPSPEEQTAIAKILTAFDDKIELLQAQNKTLESIAQTIFKEWFGKYQIGDLSADKAGELPEGWRVGKLGELALKISKGTTPRKKDLEGLSVEIPFLKVKDISNEGLISKSNLELIPKEVHIRQLQRSILKTNDILFSIAGTIGRVAIVDDELNNSNCNQALAFIRLKDKASFREYVHLWLKSKEIQNEINNNIVQGVQANVSLTVLNNLIINIPDITTLNKWKELIKPIYRKLEINHNQIQTLKQTRDTLLPKLMSGQLRVKMSKL